MTKADFVKLYCFCKELSSSNPSLSATNTTEFIKLFHSVSLSDSQLTSIRLQVVLLIEKDLLDASVLSVLPSHTLYPLVNMDSKSAANTRSHVSLSNVLLDLGYIATASETILKKIFQQLHFTSSNANKTLDSSNVAQVLMLMTSTSKLSLKPLSHHKPSEGLVSSLGLDTSSLKHMPDDWNFTLFFKTAQSLNDHLDLSNVLSKLDDPHFTPDPPTVQMIFAVAKSILPDMLLFPMHVFLCCKKWKHPKGQIGFIKQLLLHFPAEWIVNNKKLADRKVFHPDQLSRENAASKALITASFANQPWNSLDLLETCVALCDGDTRDEARMLIESGIQQTPELLALGLASLEVNNAAQQEYLGKLLLGFIAGHPNSFFVISKLWQMNPPLVVQGLVQLYNKDHGTLSRVLDIAQEVKGLTHVLEAKSYKFVIDLAALASRRDYLNLEKWIADKIREDPDEFIGSCLDFLTDKINLLFSPHRHELPPCVPMSVDVITTFLRILQSYHATMSEENLTTLKEVIACAQGGYPRQVAQSPPAQEERGEFTPDVEEEANAYFVRIYKGEIRIPHMIELFLRFKNSANPRERQVFSCMIYSLFDEYKFFPRYPEKELAITSLLFGSLIQHQIVSGASLGNALRYVLDALRQPIGSNLFKFGVQALSQFQSRLIEWPQYCSLVLQIPHLVSAHPELVHFVKSTRQPIEGGHVYPEEPSMGPMPSNPAAATPGFDPSHLFTALNVSLLANDKEFETPNEATQDKILFIINNISPTNLDQKITEMVDIFNAVYSRWLCRYIVGKRVTIEPNYHGLYVKLLDGLKSKQVEKSILEETLISIGTLLNSEKTVKSSEERTLLKNLGMWLGVITLAKNRPIKHKHLSFKDLLLQGYDHNRLIVVIPFVCKVLEQVVHSKVFKPPNPWLMAIMKLLSELYHYADLKLNLKFEIEVLCKNLTLDVKDIGPTNLLRSRPIKGMGASEQMAKTFEGLSLNTSEETTSVIQPGLGSGAQGSFGAHALQTGSSTTEDTTVGFPNLASFITFNPSLPIFQAQPSLKRIVHFAIDRAIREIMGPVVERSVTIAGIATRELVVKDFALESDEIKMRKSAHYMVQCLGGSLASVTSREPLRISMLQHLRTLLLQNGFTEQTVPEQARFIIVSDNLDLACSIVEKTAAEKAIAEVDEALATAFMNRRKHRERTGQPYYDMAVYAASRYPSTLPESLRLKPNGLTPHQLGVYEDFSRVPRLLAMQEERAAGSRAPVVGREPTGLFSPTEDNAPLSTAMAFEKFTQLLVEIEKHFAHFIAQHISVIPPQHDIHALLRQIPLVIQQSQNKEEVALLMTQRVLNLLFKHRDALPLEIYVLLLERLCEMSRKVAKEVFQWLLYHDDDRKYNIATFYTILQARLLSIPELDMQLARLMEMGRMSVVEFSATLMKKCLFEEPFIATQNDFFNSIEMLHRLEQQGMAPEAATLFLEELKEKNTSSVLKEVLSKDQDKTALKEHLGILFSDWVRSFHHPSSSEKSQAAHVHYLLQQGVLQGEDVSSLFFRICTELSVEMYLKNKTTPNAPPSFAFQAVDAFARLIVLLVKQYNDAGAANVNIAKINLATKILSIILLVLVHSHEQKKTQFNQRPYFRLFSTLLSDLHAFESVLQPAYFQILSAISNTFHTLQPSFLPGFTLSWLQLISHRHFMATLLNAENQKGWPFFQRLLVDLFKFMAPFLCQTEMTDGIRLLYKGTLRVLLVLLHDFPEFLCSYHFSFMDVIPHQCIQLRNLILSAFPAGMKLPDPFTPNLKVDLLPEISQSPQILSDYTSSLISNHLKADIDQYLKSRNPISFLVNLKQRLTLPQPDPVTGTKYNVPAIHALVLYVGIQAISQVQSKPTSTSPPTITQSAPMDIFQQLMNDLDSEGRYFFLSALANHLRYPNSHTHYFSSVLLYLFAEAKQEIVQEQITRVLLERLIVNRPHPYGLLITFIELIRNARYNFWEHTNFIRCAPEIERLFSSVAKSINSHVAAS